MRTESESERKMSDPCHIVFGSHRIPHYDRCILSLARNDLIRGARRRLRRPAFTDGSTSFPGIGTGISDEMKTGIGQRRRRDIAVAENRITPASIGVLMFRQPMQACLYQRIEFGRSLRLMPPNQLQCGDRRGGRKRR